MEVQSTTNFVQCSQYPLTPLKSHKYKYKYRIYLDQNLDWRIQIQIQIQNTYVARNLNWKIQIQVQNICSWNLDWQNLNLVKKCSMNFHILKHSNKCGDVNQIRCREKLSQSELFWADSKTPQSPSTRTIWSSASQQIENISRCNSTGAKRRVKRRSSTVGGQLETLYMIYTS